MHSFITLLRKISVHDLILFSQLFRFKSTYKLICLKKKPLDIQMIARGQTVAVVGSTR